MLVAALIPLLQAPEGMGSAILLLRNRYDVRGALLAWSMALRLAAIAIGASFGLVETFVGIVVAQARLDARPWRSSASRSFAASRGAAERGPRRRPAAIRAFAVQSTIASGLASLRGPRCRPCSSGSSRARSTVGYFRIAQAPQTAFASLSAPVRLVLLAEQTRDVEHGRARSCVRAAAPLHRRHDRAARLVGVPLALAGDADARALGLRRAGTWARRTRSGSMLVAAAHPAGLRLDEVVPGLDRAARAAHRRRTASRSSCSFRSCSCFGCALGRDGRRRRRCSARSAVFAVFWTCPARRACAAASGDGGAAVKVLIVSGIWPPDVGGPASHAPELAACLAARGHGVEVVTTADAAAGAEAIPVHWVSRRCRRASRHAARSSRWSRGGARGADVVYTTSMFGRSAARRRARAPRRSCSS